MMCKLEGNVFCDYKISIQNLHDNNEMNSSVFSVFEDKAEEVTDNRHRKKKSEAELIAYSLSLSQLNNIKYNKKLIIVLVTGCNFTFYQIEPSEKVLDALINGTNLNYEDQCNVIKSRELSFKNDYKVIIKYILNIKQYLLSIK